MFKYIRTTKDFTTLNDKLIKEGTLGVWGGYVAHPQHFHYDIHFTNIGKVMLPQDYFKILKDEDKIKTCTVDIEGLDNNYTLTEDQLNLDINDILEDVKDIELEDLEDEEIKITLTVKNMSIKDINNMPEFQGF